MDCLIYRICPMKPLDKCTIAYYTALGRTERRTEPYRIRDTIAHVLLYRIEHYAPTEENDQVSQAAGVGYGGLDDPGSR
jgi:hypothetical protein